MMGQLGRAIKAHGRSHALDRVRLTKEGVNRLTVVRFLFQGDNQLVQVIDMFPGFR